MSGTCKDVVVGVGYFIFRFHFARWLVISKLLLLYFLHFVISGNCYSWEETKYDIYESWKMQGSKIGTMGTGNVQGDLCGHQNDILNVLLVRSHWI